MLSWTGSPTATNQMEAIQSTENIIEEPQLLRIELSGISHKGFSRRLLNQAKEVLQNEDTTLEALAKPKLSKKNEEIEALTFLEALEEEIEETSSFTEENDNCVFELDKMIK